MSIWINKNNELKSLCDQLADSKLIALDTEFIRADTYYPKIALIQLSDGKSVWDKGKMKQNAELRTLESVCVQHEIDHLNGIRCLDRGLDLTFKREKPKIGRNEPCHCGSGKKYKRCCL